jgi:hypothetical protein
MLLKIKWFWGQLQEKPINKPATSEQQFQMPESPQKMHYKRLFDRFDSMLMPGIWPLARAA